MMGKYFIKSISIEGFRGINNIGNPLVINFTTDGVTSIFGENGKGKSSIFEAFLFSILGRIIRFDDYHGDIRDKKTIKNLFHSGDGNIKIEFIDDAKRISDINVTVNTNGDRSISSGTITNPETFLVSLCSSLNFLDYKSFEKILLTSSEETGKLFSNLVGFGGFIKIKDKFDKISRTQNINTDFGKLVKEEIIRTNTQKISELKIEIQKKLSEIGITADPNNQVAILKIVKLFLKKQYSFNAKGNLKNAEIDFDTIIKNKIGLTYEENVSKLNSNQDALKEIILLKDGINKFSKKTLNSLSKKLKLAYSQVLQNDIVLGKLYDDAIKSYDSINDFNRNTCVLCNTEGLGDSSNNFYEKINDKIKSYKKFKFKYNIFFTEYLQKLKECKIIEVENKFSNEGEQFFANSERSQDYLHIDYFDANSIEEVIIAYKAKVKNEVTAINTSIKELKVLIPPKISELVEIHNTHKFVFNSLIEINNLSKENDYNKKYLVELESWINFTTQIKEDYENAYNELMDKIALMIDADTKFFFKEIMGNVEITPKLKKENRGQKVNILLEKFYSNTTDIKAASLLSESYRNALSLSIYFAAALKSKNPGSFIIVDDITSSFDSGHQLYLLDLIKRKISINPSNKKGKQVIFLTHDGLLKKVLNENNSLKNWSHFTLNSNKDIVSTKPFKSDDLKLIIQDKISNSDYVGSDFRMYYEFVLLEIIEKLNLEIPFSLINNNDNKMVGKLSMAIQEIIELKRGANKIRGVGFPNKTDFKVHTQQLVNNLSHWASGSQVSLTSSVLNKIVDDIDVFKKLFQYNCTCPQKNAGWVYFRTLTSPKQKNCTCTI